jgi:hypothetical protein
LELEKARSEYPGQEVTITPEAGKDSGTIDSEVAMLAFSALFNCTMLRETE